MSKVIQWESSKKLKFGHTKLCYMQKPNLSKKIRRTYTNGILTYKRITESRPDDQTL